MPEYDVFVSHTWTDDDLPRARQIADALKTAGLRVWFDENEVKDFESITRAVQQGLAKSKSLLANYSRTYPTLRACQWELTAAFLAAEKEGDPRRRVLVVNPESGTDHIYPVELRDAKHRVAPTSGDGGALQSLAEAVCRHVDGLKGLLGDLQPLAPPLWYGMRGVGSTRFVGRLEEMWQLHSLLGEGDVAMTAGTTASGAGVAQVHGLAGAGKSLLAEEYALRFGAAYPGGVFWVRAYGNDDAKASMGREGREAEHERQVQDFAARLGLGVKGKKPPEIEAALAREIERRGQACLWVVDDVPGRLDGELLRRWFAPHPLARTLVTTRSREYGAQAGGIDLTALPPHEAYQLLTSRRAPANEAEREQAQRLADDLGGHALALDVAGAALASFGGAEPFRNFRAELERKGKDALEFARTLADALPHGHEASVAQTLLRCIERLGPEAQDFLRLAALLAVAPIPAPLAMAVFEKAGNLTRRDVHWRQTRAFDEVTAASLAVTKGETGEARAVHTLVSCAMRFRDHPRGFVNALLRWRFRRRTKALRAAAIEALTAEIAEAAEERRLHPGIEFHLAHALEMVSRPGTIADANLLGWVARYHLMRAGCGPAGVLYFRQLEFRHRELGPEHPETLASMNNLALALKAKGDLAGARKLHEKTLALRQRVLGPQHPGTLSSMNNLALTLEAQGDLAGARKLQEETLAVFRRVHGPEHPDTLNAMSNLAITLSGQGDLAAARKLREEMLAVCRCVLGPEHPNTTVSAWNLFGTLHEIGELDAGRALLERDLAWLLRRDPATLGAEQREIREMVAEAVRTAKSEKQA